MNNFKILLLQELAGQMKTFTFWVMIPLAFIVSLMVTNFQVSVYKENRKMYQEQQFQSLQALSNVLFYSQLKVDTYMPPSLLGVFSKGLDDRIGNKITISITDQPEIKTTSQKGNVFMKIFNNIDIVKIIMVLSIFIVLLAACPIAQDKENQIEKLIYSNSVGIFEYYFSKYLSLVIVVFTFVFTIFIIPFVWMFVDPVIDFNLTTITSILLLMISSILYLSVFVFISLTVSSLNSKMSMAILTSLMIWVSLVFIYPFTLNSIINRIVSVPSDHSIEEQIKILDMSLELENYKFMKDNNSNVNRGWCLLSITSTPPGIVDAYGIAEKKYFDMAKKNLDFALPKWWERIRRVEDLKDQQKQKLLYKKELFESFSFFIPDLYYQNLCDKLAGTDYISREKNLLIEQKNIEQHL